MIEVTQRSACACVLARCRRRPNDGRSSLHSSYRWSDGCSATEPGRRAAAAAHATAPAVATTSVVAHADVAKFITALERLVCTAVETGHRFRTRRDSALELPAAVNFFSRCPRNRRNPPPPPPPRLISPTETRRRRRRLLLLLILASTSSTPRRANSPPAHSV